MGSTRAARRAGSQQAIPTAIDNAAAPPIHANRLGIGISTHWLCTSRKIAQLVSAGFSNKQIARQLATTEGTIKVHLHNVYDKLAIRNRTMLALLCVEQIEVAE